MSKKVVIVGGGIAGYTLALELSSSDMDITVIEKDVLGGTCLNKGCIPTKSMIYQSSKKRNIKEIFDRTKEIIDVLRNRIKLLIEKNEISYINDEAKIISNGNVLLKKSKKILDFDILVLATGSTVYIPSVFSGTSNVIT